MFGSLVPMPVSGPSREQGQKGAKDQLPVGYWGFAGGRTCVSTVSSICREESFDSGYRRTARDGEAASPCGGVMPLSDIGLSETGTISSRETENYGARCDVESCSQPFFRLPALSRISRSARSIISAMSRERMQSDDHCARSSRSDPKTLYVTSLL